MGNMANDHEPTQNAQHHEHEENSHSSSNNITPKPPPASPSSTIRSYLLQHIPPGPTSRADLPLLLCCLISGIVDSTIYNAYGTFVSMQTGNTIFIGLGAATALHNTHTEAFGSSKPFGWAKSLMSVACFVLGCVMFSRILPPVSFALLDRGSYKAGKKMEKKWKRSRAELCISFSLQLILVIIAAALIQGGAVSQGALAMDYDSQSIDWRTLAPIALLSFQSAGQIVTSRALEMGEVPTVVVTSMLHDLSTDEAIFQGKNTKRNRRVVAFVSVMSGAIMGGFVSEKSRSVQVGLWVAAGLKGVLVIAWMLWRGEVVDDAPAGSV